MKLIYPLLALALFSSSARAETKEAKVEVNVNVELTDAGRKLALPTREHPTYYFPLVGGYHEKGAVVAGEKAPPNIKVIKKLARTLADNGYLVAGVRTPAPTVLLVLHWGSLKPQTDEVDSGDPDVTQNMVYNQKEMLALVGAQTLTPLAPDFDKEEILQEAEEDRYFVIITAFDFAAARYKKKVLLWRTKMSVPTGALNLGDVITALITSGGPYLGRETLRPVRVEKPVYPEGKVTLGELKEKSLNEPADRAEGKPVGK